MNGYTRGLAGLEWNPGVKPGILSGQWLQANAAPASTQGNTFSQNGLEIYALTDDKENPGKIFVQVKNADGRYTGRWVDPNDPYDLAIINGDYAAALDLAEARLERNPNDPDALFDKAYALSHLDRPEDSIAYYDKVIALNPNNDTAINNKAVELGKLGREAEALEFFQQAHELNPDSLIIKSNLAYSLLEAGNHAEYVRLMGEVLDTMPATLEDRLFIENFKAETGMYSSKDLAPAVPAPAPAAPAPSGPGGLF